MSRFLSS